MKTSEMAQKIDADEAAKPVVTKTTLSGLCLTTLKLNPKKHAACKASWCECSCHHLEGIVDPLTGQTVLASDRQEREHSESEEDLLASYYGLYGG